MILTIEQQAHAKAMGWNPEKTYSVSVTDVWISRDVQISIGRQVKALCVSFGLPYSFLRDSMTQHLYWYETTGRLGVVIHVRGSDVETIHLEIPEGHWGFREKDRATQ